MARPCRFGPREKLVLHMLTSLDGFIADAGGDVSFGSWSSPPGVRRR